MRQVSGTRPEDGQTAQPLAPLIERARRILLHEQKTGHADAAVKPDGLESFLARWADDLRATGRPEAQELAAIMSQRLAGYHALDPMRRTAQVRAALALLDGPPNADRRRRASCRATRAPARRATAAATRATRAHHAPRDACARSA